MSREDMIANYEAKVMIMQVQRQGLQYAPQSEYEVLAKRSVLDVDDEFRWHIAPSVKEWIKDHCEDRVWLRCDHSAQLLVSFLNDTDATLFRLKFA